MTDTRARAEQIAGGHYECDDSWYSCPLSTDGCADKRQEGCTCGRDRLVQQIDAALADERRRALEEAAVFMCADCQNGMPLELEFDREPGFWHSDEKEGTWKCKGWPIRAKAQAGPEEERKS